MYIKQNVTEVLCVCTAVCNCIAAVRCYSKSILACPNQVQCHTYLWLLPLHYHYTLQG